MPNLEPTNYELKFGMYAKQNKLVGQINVVYLTKCQIRMANLTNYKSQWTLSMVNLIKLWSSWWTPRLFDQIFGLSHG